ncbi:MAG: ABC transporter permease [Clostridiales bacterium]|jgi:simple sugar transport system permease protein|nr:ABC transporter permease [Clostridiales bacterium]
MLKEKTVKNIKSGVAAFCNALIPVLLAFVGGALIIAAARENPFSVYATMLGRALFTPDGFMRVLHVAAPLILTGLAIGVTFKANVFNMGVEGQMLLGGFVAGIIGASMRGVPAAVHIPLCLTAAVFSGALFALVPALLKAYFKVNEMVVTLMLNYAAVEILAFLAEGVFRDPSAGYVSTDMIAGSAAFGRLFGTNLTAFFLIALAAFAVMAVVFKKSRLGYEITAIGKNPEFAEAAGMNVRKKIIAVMLLSGALAGLAGAGWMLGEKYRYTLDFSGSPGLGWDGMLVSLLGSHSVFGILIAAVFYGALKVGVSQAALFTKIPNEIIFVIQALIILFLSVSYLSKNVKFREGAGRIFGKIKGIFKRKKGERTDEQHTL